MIEAQVSELKVTEFSSGVPFAADYFTSNGTKVAMISVRFYPEMDIDQATVKTFGKLELSLLDAEVRRNIALGLESIGSKVRHWQGTKKKVINEHLFLVTEYTRSSATGGGDLRVRLYRLLKNTKSFTLILSRQIAQEPPIALVTDAIASSIQIPSTVLSPGESQVLSLENKNLTNETEEFEMSDETILILVNIAVFAVGLVPSILARKYAFKRLLGRLGSFGFVAVLAILYLLISILSGGEGRANLLLWLILVVSFFILRGGKTESQE